VDTPGDALVLAHGQEFRLRRGLTCVEDEDRVRRREHDARPDLVDVVCTGGRLPLAPVAGELRLGRVPKIDDHTGGRVRVPTVEDALRCVPATAGELGDLRRVGLVLDIPHMKDVLRQLLGEQHDLSVGCNIFVLELEAERDRAQPLWLQRIGNVVDRERLPRRHVQVLPDHLRSGRGAYLEVHMADVLDVVGGDSALGRSGDGGRNERDEQ
jgi:hypothetical protein